MASSPAKVLNQDDLLKALRSLFTGYDILVNSRKIARVQNPSTGYYLEIDLWIPDLKIGFEFQDSYHYSSAWYSHVTLDNVQRKDNFKKKSVEDRGDTLIAIPCWWDGTHESLIATIRAKRKDLLRDHEVKVPPISLIPPSDYFSSGTNVPDVGELMLASFPNSYEFNTTLSVINPWWIGEKYDGVRCCWHPNRRKLFNRSGLEMRGLHNHLAKISVSCFVDAELWLGRGTFLDLQTHGLRDSPNLRMISFDDPSPARQNSPFEERYSTLLLHIPRDHPFSIIPSRALCIDRIHLSKSTNLIVKDEGEGLILRMPQSVYEHGRSTSLLKLKASRADKEALVTRVDADGVCQLQLPDGLSFEAVSSKKGKPARGDVVTYSFQPNFGRTTNPILPKVERVRTDVSWEDVIRQHIQAAPIAQILNAASSEVVGYQPREHGGNKVHAKRKLIRSFFENLAKRKNKDPLLPETWYSFRPSFIRERKGAKEVLRYFGGSFVKALLYVFPEIGLDTAKFPFVPKNHWESVTHRRNYFDSIARQRRMNPSDPHTWYTLSPNVIFNSKGGSTLMAHYGDSYIRAVTHLYPDIGLDETLFPNITRSYWKNKEHQKEAFDGYARRGGFDPLVPSNWYHITFDAASSHKGILATLAHYEGSFVKALAAIYPTMSLDDSKFGSRWNFGSEKNRKKFLMKFAEDQGFNPLLPSKWYSFSADQFKSHEGGSALLWYYGGSLVKALLHLFPNIGLDVQQFSIVPHKYWAERSNRRAFFERFARSREFDPLIARNWYPVTSTELINSMEPGASSVLTMYGSVAAGVLDVFPDIGLVKDDFVTHSNQYWLQPENRRNFFINFARRKNFDPLHPDQWYPVTAQELSKQKDSNVIHAHYNGSFVTALLEVFPNIGLDKSKFVTLARKYWVDARNRRRVFHLFASQHNFDPFIPENWYSIQIEQFIDYQDGLQVLSHYNGSFGEALEHLFPNIGIDSAKFNCKT